MGQLQLGPRCSSINRCSVNTGQLSTMAMITVGIDTSRSYNRKNPPGGKVSDVFSFDGSQDDSKKSGKINRQRSSIDLGLEPESQTKSFGRQTSVPVEASNNNKVRDEPVEASTTTPTDDPKPQVQPKEKAPDSTDDTKVSKEPKQQPEKNAVKSEPKTIEVLESKPEKPEPKVILKENAVAEQNVEIPTEVITEKPQAQARKPVEQIREAPEQKASEEPAAKVPEPSVIQTAPVAKSGSRRVPPGGHCSQLW